MIVIGTQLLVDLYLENQLFYTSIVVNHNRRGFTRLITLVKFAFEFESQPGSTNRLNRDAFNWTLKVLIAQQSYDQMFKSPMYLNTEVKQTNTGSAVLFSVRILLSIQLGYQPLGMYSQQHPLQATSNIAIGNL